MQTTKYSINHMTFRQVYMIIIINQVYAWVSKDCFVCNMCMPLYPAPQLLLTIHMNQFLMLGKQVIQLSGFFIVLTMACHDCLPNTQR